MHSSFINYSRPILVFIGLKNIFLAIVEQFTTILK